MNIVEFSASQNISLSMIFIAAYLAAMIFIRNKEVSFCMISCLASQIYCLSPAYNATLIYQPSLVFLVYASIYFTVIKYLHTYKVMVTCFIMAFFELIMYKAFLNEIGHREVEEFLYINYESIVTLLHVVIILSLVSWGRVRSAYRIISNSLLRPFLHSRLLLPYRG